VSGGTESGVSASLSVEPGAERELLALSALSQERRHWRLGGVHGGGGMSTRACLW
jgi:hypothetical protein